MEETLTRSPVESPGPLRGLVLAVFLLAVLSIASACSSGNAEVSFQPAMLPVKLTWENGNVKVSGERGIVTPIGVIGLNANVTFGEPDKDSFYVIFRDRRRSVANVYVVNGGAGSFQAIVNGLTRFHLEDRRFVIDVIDGETKTITFQRVPSAPQDAKAGVAGTWTPGIVDRWNEYWETTWHEPFEWARWAYDDSTIGAVPPFGFLWFLVRLVLAIVLGLIDLILLVLCLIAALAFVIGGSVAMNIVYGLAALLGISIAVGVVRTVLL